jgi:hypothetical protein
MAQKNSPTATKIEPDLNERAQDNVGHDGEQLELPDIPKPAFCPSWPGHATMCGLTLDLMLTGARINMFDMPDEYRRISAYIQDLENKFGWPVKAAPLKHPRKTHEIAQYWLDQEIILQARTIRPDGLMVTQSEHVADVRNRATIRGSETNATGKSVSNSVKANVTNLKATGALNSAIEFVKRVLTGKGHVPTKEVESLAAEAGVAPKTLERAGKAVKVQKVKVGTRWFWTLPASRTASDDNLDEVPA